MGGSKCVNDTTPPGPPPANEAVVASVVESECSQHIAPWCSGSKDPENAIKNTTSFTRGTPRGLLGSIGLIAAHS